MTCTGNIILTNRNAQDSKESSLESSFNYPKFLHADFTPTDKGVMCLYTNSQRQLMQMKVEKT